MEFTVPILSIPQNGKERQGLWLDNRETNMEGHHEKEE